MLNNIKYLFSVIIVLFSGCMEDQENITDLNPDKGKIEARIIDQDKNCVSGVSVLLNPGEIEYTSGGDGDFITQFLEKGIYSVALEKPDYVDTTHLISINAGIITKSDFVILIKGSIQGRVTDPLDGSPIPDMKITTVPYISDYYTDSEGYYRIQYITAGSYMVQVESADTFTDSVKNVNVMNGVTKTVNFGMIARGRIEGIVSDIETGLPMKDVLITTEPATDQITTDTLGRYCLVNLADGNYTVMTNISGERYIDQSITVEVISEQVTNLDFNIQVKGSIEGTVKNPEDNSLVAGAKITISPGAGEYFTDEYGQYRISYLDEGSYIVKVHNIGTIADDEMSVIVKNGEITTADFGLVAKGRISGTAIDQDGVAVNGAVVAITPGDFEFTTDSEGKFLTTLLYQGNYLVRITKENYADVSYSAVVDSGMIMDETYQINILGSINGKVTDHSDDPVEGAKVFIFPGSVTLYSDSQGEFSVNYLEAGEYSISLSKENYADQEYQRQVVDGEVITETYQLPIKGSISGVIKDKNGNLLQNAKITTEPVTETIFSDASGHFEFMYLDEGDYIVDPLMENYCGNNLSVSVSNGNTEEIEFLLDSPIEYEGKTYDLVDIADQCWLKQNLDIGTMIRGDQEMSDNGEIEKYCYNNDPQNCEIYGGIYQWTEAMQYQVLTGVQGICPEGWHIPDMDDFGQLITNIKNDGNTLKAVGQGSGNGAGTNTSGFSAMLAGTREIDGNFYYLNKSAIFWISKPEDNNKADELSLGAYSSNIIHGWGLRNHGNSVRCIKD